MGNDVELDLQSFLLWLKPVFSIDTGLIECYVTILKAIYFQFFVALTPGKNISFCFFFVH
jgi:hypothetical protein